MYPSGRGGKRYLSPEGRAFKEEAQWMLAIAGVDRLWQAPPEARLSLSLRFWFDKERRQDISNRVKAIEDVLATALGFDDSVIDRLYVERAGVDTANPRTEVELTTLEEADGSTD
jgi:Holliday junction resolvase RusA-like endonuclease